MTGEVPPGAPGSAAPSAAPSAASPWVLGDREAAVLRAYLDRILRWDRAAAVRLVTRPQALGCYAAPPMGVLAFLAVPLSRPAGVPGEGVPGAGPGAGVPREGVPADGSPTAGRPTGDLDLTCPAAVLRTPLEAPAREDGSRVVAVPDPVPGTAALADLPPADGWHLPIPGVSGDIVGLVDEAVAEFRRGVAADPSRADALAEQIWDRPLWGGLPVRVLHCARLLGFLPADGSRVAAATAGPWKRLTTGRGQVFVRSGAVVGHLSLLPPP